MVKLTAVLTNTNDCLKRNTIVYINVYCINEFTVGILAVLGQKTNIQQL